MFCVVYASVLLSEVVRSTLRAGQTLEVPDKAIVLNVAPMSRLNAS